MGYNLLGSWHNKPFGRGAGKHSTTWYGRIWFLILTTLWIFTFAFLSLFEAISEAGMYSEDIDYFFTTSKSLLGEGKIPMTFEYIFETLGNTVLVNTTCLLFIYSIGFPLLGVAYLFSIDLAHHQNERLDQGSLGDSLLLGWFVDDEQDSKYAILGIYEPLIFFLLAAFLYISGAFMPSLFFGLAALGMLIQGQQKRLSYRKMLDELNANRDKGSTILKKEKKIKKTMENSPKSDDPNKDHSGAQPL